MKKLVSAILFVVILVVMSVCYAENNVALYTDKLANSTWIIALTQSGNGIGSKISFRPKVELKGEPSHQNYETAFNIPIITGDETGAVYLLYAGNSFDINGTITFTKDEDIMVITGKTLAVLKKIQ